MKLLWSLSYKGKCVRLCWIPSHCGIGGMKLRTISKRGPWPRHKPTDQCPLYRFEATGQFRHSAVGSNQMGCSLTWHKYISLGTNTGAIEQFPALNQSWRSCNHPTLSWPYRSHQVPCPVPRTTDCFSPLWPNTDHCPYAPAVCSVTGISWRIILSWLIEYSIYDNSRYLHSGIPSRSGILLSDMNGQTFYTMPHLNHPRSDAVF